MATTRKPKSDAPPVTVTFDPPEVDEVPNGTPLDDKTLEDFTAKVAGTTPPKSRSASKAVGKRPSVESELDRLRDELNRNVNMVGMLMCAKDAYMGQLILQNKDELIDNWIDVCRINPTIRHALMSAMDMGVYATALVHTLALVIAMLAHLKILPNSDMILMAVPGAGITVPSPQDVSETERMFDLAAMFSKNGDAV